ncbi:hypothetical protein H2204_011976 [Knufia peltigerae]|uniref:Uncharacterized protein n=1 Tax=Knufia peltigerae TaxID=1002370 RepID=A0AA38XTC9_9EURO|nr:hypothetical protein H2204_011976 [Knufia peltigerae]
MTVFGKRAKFDCTIGIVVKIMATIALFELGPLKVRAAIGEDPIVDIEVSLSTRKILIDGGVDLWALSARGSAQIYPKPKFDSSSSNNIIDMLDEQINWGKGHADFDEAKRMLVEKENELSASVRAAQNRLDEANVRDWENKKSDMISALDRAKSEAQRYKQHLEDNLATAENSYASVVIAAVANLNEARHDAAIAIHLSETDLRRSHSQLQEVVRLAQSEVNEKLNARLADSQRVMDSMISPAEKTSRERHKCAEVPCCGRDRSLLGRALSTAQSTRLRSNWPGRAVISPTRTLSLLPEVGLNIGRTDR